MIATGTQGATWFGVPQIANGQSPIANQSDATNQLNEAPTLHIVRTRMNDNPASSSHAWLMFTLVTVLSWGVYGILLHKGQVAMGDPVNGRYKAFLFVGIAYFLTAVLAPLAMLAARGTAFSGYTASG